DCITRGLLSIGDAENCVARYRAIKANLFPFVIIPSDWDTESFRCQAPFLFLAVLTAASENNPALQSSLAAQILSEVSRRVVIQSEKSLEILQGLLVHTCWYHYHFRKSSGQQLYLLLKIAVSLVVDLGIDKNPFGSFQPSSTARDDKTKLAAGKRALLGCFYLCSV
ncbi:hypothetical protein K432DRAFT_301475, partial [Lepidopterella palustris CBS 459.81]